VTVSENLGPQSGHILIGRDLRTELGECRVQLQFRIVNLGLSTLPAELDTDA
jgi:hypothetical protein